ncbi:MAG: hypothetical protein U5L96_02025 [Owenweeksia sp.]|nr:hypothetical protein [Owenweeksia sp.]
MLYIQRFLTVLIICPLFQSCSPDYQYWPLKHFSINKDALQNGEKVKLLYTSRGPDANQDLSYYYHLLVVSESTGDTVNVLTYADNGFEMGDAERSFLYFDRESLQARALLSSFNSITDFNKMKNSQPPVINKVARDPAYDQVADNNFPTVIGVIGYEPE